MMDGWGRHVFRSLLPSFFLRWGSGLGLGFGEGVYSTVQTTLYCMYVRTYIRRCPVGMEGFVSPSFHLLPWKLGGWVAFVW